MRPPPFPPPSPAGGKVRVAVLGGGVSGVVLSGELAAGSAFAVDLIEREPRLGGLHRGVEIGGVSYDIGAFIFSRSNALFDVFPEVADSFPAVTTRFVSVTPTGRLDNYPLTLRGYVRDNGFLTFCASLADIARCKILHRRRGDLPAFIKYYIGGSIYRRSGLKSYIERLYCMDDAAVDVEFARKRLAIIEEWCSARRVSLRLLRRPKKSLGGTPIYPDHLVRPREGFGRVYGTIRDALCRRGVSVFNDCDVRSIRRAGGGFEIDAAGTMTYYDRVISTIPIPALARLIGVPLRHSFEGMQLVSLFYRFRGEPGHDSSFLFNFTPEGRWKRVITFSSYYGPHEGDQYFAVEVTVPPSETVDPDGVRRDFEAHARKLGLFAGELKFQGSLTTPNAYPIYRRDNIEKMAEEKERVRRWGIDLAGRQGEFDYISSSDAAGNARAIAARLKEEYAGGRTVARGAAVP